MDRIDDIDIPLEKALLASLLVRGEMLQEIIEILEPHHFLLASHQMIYRTMLDLHRNQVPVDLVYYRQESDDKRAPL
jgi:replicative DNA helicase